MLIQHQHFQVLGRDDHKAAIGGYALAAQHALGLQRQLVGVGLGSGGLGGADGGAAGGLQSLDGLLVDGQAQAVTGAVQAVGHNAIGHTGGIKAVDQLVHGLVLVDVQLQVGSGTGLGVDAGGLVVVLDRDFGITHRDLDLARLGVALVAVVKDVVVTGHKLVAQLSVHQLAPAFLICMCHNWLLSVKLTLSSSDSSTRKQPPRRPPCRPCRGRRPRHRLSRWGSRRGRHQRPRPCLSPGHPARS